MRNILLMVFFSIVITVGIALSLIPQSIQIQMGSLNGCEVNDEHDLKIQEHTIKNLVLAKLFRLKHLYLGGPLEYKDDVTGESNPFHALILSSGFYKNTSCEESILPLFEKYIDLGADVDFYEGSEGLTPLHAAIIWGKPTFVKILIENGANRDLKVRKVGDREREITGKNATELAELLLVKSNTNSRVKILEALR